MVRTKNLMAIAAVTAAAVGLAGVAPASADGPSEAGSANAGPAARGGLVPIPGAKDTKKVTLITGDQVWLTRSSDESGKESVKTRIVPAKRADGRSVSFAQWGTPEEFFVVPSDVLPFVGSRVDRAIFDVVGLVNSGASESSETRVIVSFKGAASGLGAVSSALSGSASEATVLPSANAVALKVPAGKGLGFFDQLQTASSQDAYVSLDARVKALDTTSMPQIGATKAWKSGYTGKGTKVAVLDTGIDATHPDLKGQVVASKNFGDSDTTTDRFGHGTHVASIVAGTGKVGGPGMRGVAYEAKLMNGKVLDDYGYGYESEIIKGMEWAAKSGADVINMSLGGGPGNGSDPMEKSVDALTKQYGTVFAIAAGNSGEEGDGLVSSPSTAASAISVAAVDSKNRRAPFSDSGPGRGNGALKPDVSAPGVSIRAARSKVNVFESGTSPYVKLSGTSMATPHVAGAAALLAQARPDLSGPELKSVLMGGATDRKANVWQEGTGTINIPGSIGMPVIAQEGSLSFGIVPFPQSEARDRVKTIHYKNTGAKPITLTLKSDVTDAKGGQAKGVKLSRTTLTVPAKGTANVRVTVTPKADPIGSFAGAITATPSKGHAIRTTLGWTNDVERFPVTIKAIDRAGKVANASAVVFTVDDAEPWGQGVFIKGESTMKLPAGTYFAGGYVFPASGKSDEVTLGLNPQFTVKGKTTVSLGGPTGQRTQIKTPKPSKLLDASVIYGRENAARTAGAAFGVGGGEDSDWWVTPTKATTIGGSWLSESSSLKAPGGDPSYTYQVGYFTKNRVPSSLKHTVTPKEVTTSVGTHRSRVKGSAAELWVPIFKDQWFAIGGASPEFKIPNAVTTYLVGDGAYWFHDLDGPMRGENLFGDFWESPVRTYAPGTTAREDYFTGVMSPGAVSGGAAYRYADELVAFMPTYEDSAGRSGFGWQSTTTSMTAYVDGKKVRSVRGDPVLAFRAREGKNLRLVQQVDRKANWWGWTTSSTGEWTAPLPTQNARVLPLMNIQYKLDGYAVDGSIPPGEQTIGLTVSRFTNPKYFRSGLTTPKSLKLEYSVDGGKTWKQAKVKSSGKKATATFTPPAPKPGGTTKVSLRAFASDGKGSTVKETMISAYEMSGLPPGTVGGK